MEICLLATKCSTRMSLNVCQSFTAGQGVYSGFSAKTTVRCIHKQCYDSSQSEPKQRSYGPPAVTQFSAKLRGATDSGHNSL